MTYTPKRGQVTKCDFVAEQLKEQIITGVYKSGEQLPPEGALCDMFSVSRITVREATKKLNMMGLVEIKQGKGTFVKSVDLGLFMKPLFQMMEFDEIDVETIYSAREFIEGGAACLAARNRTEEDLENLQMALQNIVLCHEKQDLVGSYECDEQFHIELAKASHNPILLAAARALSEIDTACVKRFDKYLVSYDGWYTDHDAIFRAVERQDAEGAQNAMVQHARNSKAVLLK